MFKTICLVALLFAFAKGSPLPLEDFESRIVGGEPTTIASHPYQVSLRTSWNFHFCGASIISDRWVLSAAHCTISSGQTSVFVWVGTSFLDRDGVRIQSSRVVNHPRYTQSNLANDISLVQTSTIIPLNNANIRTIPMSGGFTNDRATVVVTGWGFTQTGANTPNQLQRLTTTTITNAECARSIPASFVTPEKLCTFVRTGQGICQGDSGGPLNENGWLVGIVSWNIPCAVGFPDGFERVTPHRSWITQVSGLP